MCLRGVGLTGSWGRSLWHRPSSVGPQLGPVTSSPGPQALTGPKTAVGPPAGQGRRVGGSPLAVPHASLVLFSPESLSELREYTEGLSEPAGADDCVPPATGQSVISLLSSKELQQLIEEVRVLDEATLKVGVMGRGPGCVQRGHRPGSSGPEKAEGRADAGAGRGPAWRAAGHWTVRPSREGVL